MSIERLPEWMQDLETEDMQFIRVFLLASGSLKEVAKYYDVSYPTVRLRLDKLIHKIQLREEIDNDPVVRMIKQLTLDEEMTIEAAQALLASYRKEKEKEEKRK